MAKQTWVQLFNAQASDSSSAVFDQSGSTQGIYVVGVLGTGRLILEARLPPEASNINAPDTFVPVVNGEWRQADLYDTDGYTAGALPAVGMMKTLNSVTAQYRMRLVDADATTSVWAYMTRN